MKLRAYLKKLKPPDYLDKPNSQEGIMDASQLQNLIDEAAALIRDLAGKDHEKALDIAEKLEGLEFWDEEGDSEFLVFDSIRAKRKLYEVDLGWCVETKSPDMDEPCFNYFASKQDAENFLKKK
jgi:hypothetical protein